MQMKRRPSSLDRPKESSQISLLRLRRSLSRQEHASEAKKNETTPWDHGIYRYHKSLAIKEIINDYFKEEVQLEQIANRPVLRGAHRNHRYRKA
jgi:hypothetical protein